MVGAAGVSFGRTPTRAMFKAPMKQTAPAKAERSKPTYGAAPANEVGTLQPECPANISKKGACQTANRAGSKHQHRISEALHLVSWKAGMREANGCKPIQPHEIGNRATCVAISLPLNKDRINGNDIDLFSNFNRRHRH